MNATPTIQGRKRAVAYIRVSTDKVEQKSSLANQREFFENFIGKNGDTLTHIYCDEGKSATKMANRTELNAMLRAAKDHEFDILYVKDVSRLFRNIQDFVNVTTELSQNGVQVYYVDLGQHVDPIILHLMAVMAQSESEKMSTRIKFAKALSKEKGIVPNFVFGYDRVDKWTLVPNPEEAATVRLIYDKYTEDGWGQARIAKYLHDNGYKTKKMKFDAWSTTTVGQILTSQLYIGKVINGRETTKGALTNKRNKHSEDEWIVVERPDFRIISDEQWLKAQAIRENNKKCFPKQGMKSEKHLFSNLIKCGHCGFSYRRIQRRHSKNGPLYVWWTCSRRSAYGTDSCSAEHVRIDEDWLLAAVRQLIGSMVQDKQAFYALAEQKCNTIIQKYLESTKGLSADEITRQINEIEMQRSRIKDMVVRGMMDMDEGERDMLPLNRQLEQLKFQLSEVGKTMEVVRQVKAYLRDFLSDFSALHLTENLENADLRRVIDKIEVMSKDEIYVYLKGSGDPTFTVPIRLSDTIKIDTNISRGTQRSGRAPAHLQPDAVSSGKRGTGTEQGRASHPGRHRHTEEVQRSVINIPRQRRGMFIIFYSL